MNFLKTHFEPSALSCWEMHKKKGKREERSFSLPTRDKVFILQDKFIFAAFPKSQVSHFLWKTGHAVSKQTPPNVIVCNTFLFVSFPVPSFLPQNQGARSPWFLLEPFTHYTGQLCAVANWVQLHPLQNPGVWHLGVVWGSKCFGSRILRWKRTQGLWSFPQNCERSAVMHHQSHLCLTKTMNSLGDHSPDWTLWQPNKPQCTGGESSRVSTALGPDRHLKDGVLFTHTHTHTHTHTTTKQNKTKQNKTKQNKTVLASGSVIFLAYAVDVPPHASNRPISECALSPLKVAGQKKKQNKKTKPSQRPWLKLAGSRRVLTSRKRNFQGQKLSLVYIWTQKEIATYCLFLFNNRFENRKSTINFSNFSLTWQVSVAQNLRPSCSTALRFLAAMCAKTTCFEGIHLRSVRF